MKQLSKLSGPRVFSVLALVFAISVSALPQHEGHDMSKMPGMGKPKAKTAPKKKNSRPRMRRAATRKPGMNRASSALSPSHEMHPGMKIPAAVASPSPSPSHEMSPGMKMPAGVSSPAPNPSHEMHPGMKMPAAAPSASPSPSHKMMPGMDMNAPAKGQPSDDAKKDMAGMPGMATTNMGPLMVMSGDDMGIRVGSSDGNIMSMGAMGSGTSWQPSSGPMHMTHKVAGDWLLMFHYNVTAGVNRQDGPRCVTKAESEK